MSQKVDTYLIKWYGPFSSKDDLKVWEDSRSEVFNLYVIQAIQDDDNQYYCGMAYRQSVGKRMKNHDHCIHDFEYDDTVVMIWIGTIANLNAKEYDVRICENIITSTLAKQTVGEDNLLNRTNKKPPVNDVFIINEWWKANGDELQRRTQGSVPTVIPEVMEYYSETQCLYGAYKLKALSEW